MNESVQRTPALRIFRRPLVRSPIGQELDLGARRPERDRLLLKVDLRTLVVGVGEGAHQKESHRRPARSVVPRRARRLAERSIEPDELGKSPEDDTGMGAGLSAGFARMMGHRDLADPKASGSGAHQDLGIHEGADRLDRDRVEDLSAKDLEGAIDVSDREIEEAANEGAPGAGDHAADPRIAPGCAVAGDDLDVVGVCLGQQVGDLPEVELEIRIAEEDEVASGFTQTRAKRRPIAPVRCMVDAADPWVPRAPSLEHGFAFILGPVVDDHDFEVDAELVSDLRRALEERRKILRLVEGGEDE